MALKMDESVRHEQSNIKRETSIEKIYWRHEARQLRRNLTIQWMTFDQAAGLLHEPSHQDLIISSPNTKQRRLQLLALHSHWKVNDRSYNEHRSRSEGCPQGRRQTFWLAIQINLPSKLHVHLTFFTVQLGSGFVFLFPDIVTAKLLFIVRSLDSKPHAATSTFTYSHLKIPHISWVAPVV